MSTNQIKKDTFAIFNGCAVSLDEAWYCISITTTKDKIFFGISLLLWVSYQ